MAYHGRFGKAFVPTLVRVFRQVMPPGCRAGVADIHGALGLRADHAIQAPNAQDRSHNPSVRLQGILKGLGIGISIPVVATRLQNQRGRGVTPDIARGHAVVEGSRSLDELANSDLQFRHVLMCQRRPPVGVIAATAP